MKERLAILGLAVMLATMALAACGPVSEPVAVEGTETVASTEMLVPTGVPSPATPSEPVILHNYVASEITTLDPQLAYQILSINYIENLFVNLTNRDPGTLELVPEAATSWQVSDDGLVYTFTLRTDIPWVRHDPETGETEQVLDEGGNPRTVTAHDFAYGIKRACDPGLSS